MGRRSRRSKALHAAAERSRKTFVQQAAAAGMAYEHIMKTVGWPLGRIFDTLRLAKKKKKP